MTRRYRIPPDWADGTELGIAAFLDDGSRPVEYPIWWHTMVEMLDSNFQRARWAPLTTSVMVLAPTG